MVVIGTSTGASLATWAAAQPGLSDGIATIIEISPNYGLQAAGADLLLLPWGKQIAELTIGKERSFEPVNALNALLWTTRYPTAGRPACPWPAPATCRRRYPGSRRRVSKASPW